MKILLNNERPVYRQLAKMSIGPKFVEVTADVLRTI